MPLKVISFDFDGVFPTGKREYCYEEALLRSIQKVTKRALPSASVYQMFKEFVALDFQKRKFNRSASFPSFFENFLYRHGISRHSTHEVVLEALLDQKTTYSLTEDIEPVFRYIASRGWKVALISDSIFPTLMRRVMLQRWGLLQYFDFIATSQEYHRKSGLSIFRKVAKFFMVQPNEMLHIGDTIENDVVPARRAGLHAGLISRAKVNPVTLPRNHRPDFTVKSFSELREVLKNKTWNTVEGSRF